MPAKRNAVLGAVCLIGTSVGQLLQYLVTPIGSANMSAADQVHEAVSHHAALQAAAWLDLATLLFLPALLYVGQLAGYGTSRLGWLATLVAAGTTLPGLAYLLALDPLLLAAASTGSSATGEAYANQPVVVFSTLVFLIGHVVGLVLLAVALWRTGAVPRWAAVALALYPFAEFGGEGAGVRAVTVLGYLLLVASFAACAAALLRHTPARTSTVPDAFAPAQA